MESLDTIISSVDEVKRGIKDVKDDLEAMPERITELMKSKVEMGAQHLTATSMASIVGPLADKVDSIANEFSAFRSQQQVQQRPKLSNGHYPVDHGVCARRRLQRSVVR